MKTYVITLSQFFPVGHNQSGNETNFKYEFLLGQCCPDCEVKQDLSVKEISRCNSCIRACLRPKLHTIRTNYPIWEKRIGEVQAGQAVLSVRQWTGKPYRSPQIEVAKLTSATGIGIQKLVFCGALSRFKIENRTIPFTEQLANNDGLSLDNWIEWFNGYDLNQPMAIIHFTKFRY
jgi:hypothetical protein